MGEVSASSDERDDGDVIEDPDAPWRRGFDGWEQPARVPEPRVRTRHERPPPSGSVESVGRPVADVHGQPLSATTSGVVVVAVVVAAIVIGAIAAVAALRPDTPAAGRSAPLIAVSATPAWAASFDGGVADIGVGEHDVVAAIGESLFVLDVESGDERWRRDLDGDATVDRVAVIGEQVVVLQRRSSGRSEMQAFTVATGMPLWDTVGGEGVVTISGGDDDPMLFRRTQVGSDATVELLDPATGGAIGEPLRLSGVTAAGDDIASQPSDRRVAIWSRARRQVVAGPVDAFNLWMAAAHDGRVVALDDDGRVILFDEGGRRTDEFVSDEFDGLTGRPRLVGVVDDADIGVVASSVSIGFALEPDRLELVWRRDGRIESPVVTAVGARAVLVGPTEPSGETRETIVDPADGTTVVVTDPGGKRERPPVLGHNAYVLAPTIGAPTRLLAAYDYGGRELWTTELPAGASYELANGSLVVVESDPTGSRVSLAR